MDEDPIRLRVTGEECERKLSAMADRFDGEFNRPIDPPLRWEMCGRLLIRGGGFRMKLDRPSRHLEVAGIFVIALSFALLVWLYLEAVR